MNRAVIVLAAGCLLALGCGRKPAAAPDPATRENVWAAIQPHAARYRIAPAFIYALVAAESNFDPQARNGEARGLLQLKPAAWREVNRTPYDPAVWDWRQNLATGVDYLAWCRSYLHRKNKFSYPLLLASFHYGMDYVEQRGFALDRLDVPDSPIYRDLWRGNLAPVPPPK
ncbi:MAG: lytic transglycosylase domain-containing protein [Lacunisphaera sp.]|nr:lytic transglycosylase domain-containing protein [Lacunisphaera sp.]